MTSGPSGGGIRRVLVALDASQQSQLALDAAVRLAQWYDAKLEGIYVEDINLIRLATLGVGQEIGPTSMSPDPLQPHQVARRLMVGASEAKRRLAETAEARRVRWVFRVERGNVASVIEAAAEHADVVAVGRAGAGTRGPGRLGSTARALATRHTQSVIVVQRPLTAGHTIVGFFDGSEACLRAVRAAGRLCEGLGAQLVVLVPITETPDGTSERSSQLTRATDLTRSLTVRTTVRPIGSTPEDWARAVQAERPVLCVVPCHMASSPEVVPGLTDRLGVSLYLVK